MKKANEKAIKRKRQPKLPSPDTTESKAPTVQTLLSDEAITRIHGHLHDVLLELGCDLRPGTSMHRTPFRWARHLIESCRIDPVNATCFSEKVQLLENYSPTEPVAQMIVQGPVPIYSTCEHHILPFFGHAWIGYLPSVEDADSKARWAKLRILGLSKLARIAINSAKGFNTQEKITNRIVDTIHGIKDLNPAGVAVAIRCEHMCMACRGVGVSNVNTMTQRLTGPFLHDPMSRSEFFNRVDSLKS